MYSKTNREILMNWCLIFLMRNEKNSTMSSINSSNSYTRVLARV